MTSGDLPKVVIFADPSKGDVKTAVEQFADYCRGKVQTIATCGIDQCTADVLQDADYAVVFGGDGSIIAAARQLSDSNVPVIGVNLGKLGFLAEFSLAELQQYLPTIAAGRAVIEERMMLKCSVVRGRQQQFSSAAINDVFITAGPPFRMIELQICVAGQAPVSCVSDGLIVCTPTGSTAYNLSAGGPIVSGNLEAMVITAICPHSLSFRPIVIDAARRVEVRGVRLNEGTTVSVDGQHCCGLSTGQTVHIERHAGKFLVVNNPLRTQWDTLATKLGWAQKPKYNRDRA